MLNKINKQEIFEVRISKVELMEDLEEELCIPVEMSLHGNKLVFDPRKQNSGWELECSDLETAAQCIDNLTFELQKSREEIMKLKQAIIELNETKTITMDMLLEERQRNVDLEKEVTGYKSELKTAYKSILQLRRATGSKQPAI